MSTTKTKEELTRLAWVAALRRQGHRKCEDTYRDRRGNVCALGLLLEVAGHRSVLVHLWQREVGAMAGLSESKTMCVVAMNDGSGTYEQPQPFSKIADVIEGWFP